MSTVFTRADRELLEQLRSPRKVQDDFLMEQIADEIIEDDFCLSGVAA